MPTSRRTIRRRSLPTVVQWLPSFMGFGLGVVIAGMGFFEYMDFIDKRDTWPVAQGVVLDHEVGQAPGIPPHTLTITYEYRVGEIRHRSTDIYPGVPVLRTRDQTEIDRLIRRFPVDEPCFVRYDSADPQRCCLIVRVADSTISLLRLGGLIFLAGVAVTLILLAIAEYERQHPPTIEE